MAGSVFSNRRRFLVADGGEGGYIDGMNVEMDDHWAERFSGGIVMRAALASGCEQIVGEAGGVPSSMLLPGFGSVAVGPPGFSLVEDQCDCDRSIFRVENCILAPGCPTS